MLEISRRRLKNGFLYNIFNFLIEKFKYLTLVEWFKYLAEKFISNHNDINRKITYSRISVDLFIIFKWIFIIIISYIRFENYIITICVWYLLITNLYTYFYHHIWTEESIKSHIQQIDRTRRRFINLFLAICFSNMCFAYLYQQPYRDNFLWNNNHVTFIKSLWFSISNSMAANYDFVKPKTDFGNDIAMIQLIFTFIFIAIILGKSIPQINSSDQNGNNL